MKNTTSKRSQPAPPALRVKDLAPKAEAKGGVSTTGFEIQRGFEIQKGFEIQNVATSNRG